MVLLKEPKLDHVDNQIIRSIWWNSGFGLVSNMSIGHQVVLLYLRIAILHFGTS